MNRILIVSIVSILTIFSRIESSADTIYFKNGRSLEGRIKSETGNKVIIEASFGDMECSRDQILKIGPGQKDENSQAIERKYERYGPSEIPISVSKGSKSASVEAVLNGAVKADLDIDTGASVVVLSRKIGDALGAALEDNKKDIITLHLAGGKNVDAKVIMLEKVKVGDAEAKDVMAAVLLEDNADKNVKDGLLGMSFLNRFNVKIDLKEKKMTLLKMDDYK